MPRLAPVTTAIFPESAAIFPPDQDAAHSNVATSKPSTSDSAAANQKSLFASFSTEKEDLTYTPAATIRHPLGGLRRILA
jgi:hypothetical protein